jgi:putative tryptophan/tyrosine transport system substrate-binding protein
MTIQRGAQAALVAKAASVTIPIVFVTDADPVASGLVASLNRPAANVTGIANLAGELSPKRLQLLRELIPHAAAFGVLTDAANSFSQSTVADLEVAARTLGLRLVIVNARTDNNLETGFASFSRQRVAGILVTSNAFLTGRMEQLAGLAARHGLPAIFPNREYALAGGLISYGSSLGYMANQAGIYAGRILKGEKPANLPVEQAVKIQLTLNLKTASEPRAKAHRRTRGSFMAGARTWRPAGRGISSGTATVNKRPADRETKRTGRSTTTPLCGCAGGCASRRSPGAAK